MRLPTYSASTFVLAMMALGTVSSSTGCAMHKSAKAPPADYYAMDQAEAMPGPSLDVVQQEATAAIGAPSSAPMGATAQPPSAELGSVPSTAAWSPKEGSAPDEAVADDLPTTGAESVDQMLIFNGALGLIVDADTTAPNIDAAVDLAVRSGGYIAQQSDTSVVVRVPSGRFRKVMRQIEQLGELNGRSVQTLDVSEEFHDLEVRLKNLEATRTRIQKLLSQATDLPQVLTVEKELERVSAEIDQLRGRLRYLSSQAAFSTITINFTERPREQPLIADDGELQPPPPPPPPHMIRTSVDWIGEVDVHRLMAID